MLCGHLSPVGCTTKQPCPSPIGPVARLIYRAALRWWTGCGKMLRTKVLGVGATRLSAASNRDEAAGVITHRLLFKGVDSWSNLPLLSVTNLAAGHVIPERCPYSMRPQVYSQPFSSLTSSS